MSSETEENLGYTSPDLLKKLGIGTNSNNTLTSFKFIQS